MFTVVYVNPSRAIRSHAHAKQSSTNCILRGLQYDLNLQTVSGMGVGMNVTAEVAFFPKLKTPKRKCQMSCSALDACCEFQLE